MRRLLAFLLLSALLAGPTGRVACGWTCANVIEAAASQDCHEKGGAELAFGIAVDHCDGPALPVALTAKLWAGFAAPTLGLTPSPISTGVPLSWSISESAGTTPSPPANRTIPLRI